MEGKELKTEDFSADCKNGVDLILINKGSSVVNATEGKGFINLKDELKFKILQRRRLEGKSEIILDEIPEPKNYTLSNEEREKSEKRKLANRKAAQRCRHKKKVHYEKDKKDLMAQLRRRRELMTTALALENQIVDIKRLWRLASSESENNCASMVDSKKVKTDASEVDTEDDHEVSITDSDEMEEDEIILKHSGIGSVYSGELKARNAPSDAKARCIIPCDKTEPYPDESFRKLKTTVDDTPSSNDPTYADLSGKANGSAVSKTVPDSPKLKDSKSILNALKHKLLTQEKKISSNVIKTETKPYKIRKRRKSGIYIFPSETDINTSNVRDGVISGIPTVVVETDRVGRVSNTSQNEGDRVLSEEKPSGMQLKILIAGENRHEVVTSEDTSAENIGFNFRSEDENAPHSLTSSQNSISQGAELEGYEEMKDDDNSDMDSDSDIELIELEPKLVIDLTASVE